MPLEDQLEKLDISDTSYGSMTAEIETLRDEDGEPMEELVDITQMFFDLGRDLSPHTIIKDPGFNLFEGTHSLEVNNEKLDSSLISLTDEERQFDCNLAYGDDELLRLKHVTAIVDLLTRFLVSWLNEYQTLPTTVLSCRYVEHLLIESSKAGRLTYLHSGDPLYDQVLCDAIYGICYFAKFVQKLLKAGVIFEEEDLNFNGMGLDFLSYFEEQQVIVDRLHRSIEFVESSQGDKGTFLSRLLRIIICLVKMEDHLELYSADVTRLDELIEESRYLDEHDVSQEYTPPPGCFSMSIQKRLSNRFPPKHLVVPNWNYKGFSTMAQDLKIVLKVNDAATMLEAAQLAQYFNKLTQRHVIARALFPLYFIRDDQTILGKYSTLDCIHMHLREFSAMSTTISKQSPQELEPILQEAMNVLFEWYQNTAQNTSRYRQGYNRQLLLWDALHAQMETTEFELAQRGIAGQTMGQQGRIPFMPYSSWAFSMKVTAMLDYVTKGFDLDVYKPFESFSMFWYAYYLSYNLEACLENVQQFIDSKINSIHGLAKKIKKVKTIEKKNELKAQHRHLMDTEMEQLRTNKRYLSYLFMNTAIIKSLSLAQVFQFSILRYLGIIDTNSPAKSKFTSDRLLHDLRFKPFSSIGVPDVLTYETLQSTLREFSIEGTMSSVKLENARQCMDKELQSASNAIETIKKCISAGDNNGLIVTGTRLVKEEALDYYNHLQVSVEAIIANSTTISSHLKSLKSAEWKHRHEVRLNVPKGGSPFFPLLELIEKVDRKK